MNFCPQVRACVNVASLFCFSATVKNYRKPGVKSSIIYQILKNYALFRHCRENWSTVGQCTENWKIFAANSQR
jgi:hypothetical protein